MEPLRTSLTPERRDSILAVKEGALDAGEPVAGIRVYQAVIEAGIRTYSEFCSWNAAQGPQDLTFWRPGR